ncbi:MAG: threonine synthase [Clostridia bacterium]|nr:threonine synthase [Clostridia bacterium]
MKLFFSTRGDQNPVNAPEAVLRGIAPDGGLYIRNEMPRINVEELQDASFNEIAERILGDYLTGYTREEIAGCVERAYSNKFDVEEIVPLKSVGKMHVLELFHGPTAAFKDVALSVLPQLMSCALEKTGAKDEILILTATSGDTGSAALTGFADVPGIRIIVFYPDKGISPIQRAQMTTMKGENVGVCAISGNFDDAQTGVKRIFAEIPEEFCKANGIALSSANSINIGRLVPQIVYYFSAYVDLVKSGKIKIGEKVNFSVPTGNFGDILAGYFAKLAGLPVGKLICASNANNVLTDFFAHGVYDKNRSFLTTISPSMDILVSSNLERLLYLALDGDAAEVRERMQALKDKGLYSMPEEAMDKIAESFAGGCASDAQAMAAIKALFDETGYLMDPHTAVAWKVAEDYRAATGDETPCVVLSTASPYKFPYSVLEALDEAVPADAAEQIALMEKISGTKIPAALAGVLEKDVRFKDVVAPEEMMGYVQGKAEKK